LVKIHHVLDIKLTTAIGIHVNYNTEMLLFLPVKGNLYHVWHSRLVTVTAASFTAIKRHCRNNHKLSPSAITWHTINLIKLSNDRECYANS